MATKLNLKQKRDLAEEYFVQLGHTGKECALKVDVTEATISKWRTKYDWDNARKRFISSPSKIKDLLMSQLELVANGEKAQIDADSLSKIFKVIDALGGKTAVPVVLSVFKEFDNFVAEQDPVAAVQFTEWHKKFIIYKASLDG